MAPLTSRSIVAIRGVLSIGTVDSGGDAIVLTETPLSTTQDYADSFPIRLVSTWLTGGEPSLEKCVLQLKLFGYITPALEASINVVSYKDWITGTKITDVAYFPVTSTLYSHKKRLDSDKALAASIGFEVTATGVTFEIESMEVEFNPIQVGVKR